jgi:hypothetical protein
MTGRYRGTPSPQAIAYSSCISGSSKGRPCHSCLRKMPGTRLSSEREADEQ